uniref:Hydrophobic seed protein domain-containing protein n=1 Tax=Salix viminalis TaxID=40686 RepID=A0A6N2LKE1_SALVM
MGSQGKTRYLTIILLVAFILLSCSNLILADDNIPPPPPPPPLPPPPRFPCNVLPPPDDSGNCTIGVPAGRIGGRGDIPQCIVCY